MDIGVYNLKYPFRRLIGFLLPLFKSIDPNHVSYSLIPLGLITSGVYFLAPNTPSLYLLGVSLILARMVLGTMDGLMAVKFNKETPDGEMINRIAPEVADVFLMLGLVFSAPQYLGLGAVAIACCWAVTFFGLVGIVAGRKIQSVGPVGQTDRVVALIFFSVLQYFSMTNGWGLDYIYYFLLWVIVGSLPTIGLRAYHNLKAV